MSDIIIEITPPAEINVDLGQTVPWADVTDKPTSFPPSSHGSTHLPAGTDPIPGIVTEAPINGTQYGRQDGGWTAIASSFLPPGMMAPYGGGSAPSGWLLCDGTAVSRTTYATLFTAIGVVWGVGDGSTTFNLPDLRASAPVGAGTSVGYTQNETYSLGAKYNDQMQGHWHQMYGASSGSGSSFNVGTTNNSGTYTALSDDKVREPKTDGTNGTPRTGNATRGKVVGVNYIIKT